MNGNILSDGTFSFVVGKMLRSIFHANPNCKAMTFLKIKAIGICLLFSATAFCQAEKKKLTAKRINTPIKIDGIIDEAVWKDAPLADSFISLRPTPFQLERPENATQIYFFCVFSYS